MKFTHMGAPMPESEKERKKVMKYEKRPTYPLRREVCRSVCRYMSYLIFFIIAYFRARVKLISCFRQ